MRKAVVEPSLHLEEILGRLEKVHVSFREGLEGFLAVCAGRKACKGGRCASDAGAGTNESGQEARAHHVEVEREVLTVEDVEDDVEESELPTPKCGGKVVSSLDPACRDGPRCGRDRPATPAVAAYLEAQFSVIISATSCAVSCIFHCILQVCSSFL